MAANAQWVCIGCKDEAFERALFGQIHQALHESTRLERTTYLTIDMAWVDDLLLPDAQVRVTLLDPAGLSTFVHPETVLDRYEKADKSSRVYNLVVTQVPADEATVRHPYRSSRSHVRDMHSHKLTVPVFGATTVDAFLTANPCWIPLHEPVKLQHRQQGMRRRLASQTRSHDAGSRLLLLAAMPHTPLHTTCVLYSVLHRAQFPPPAQCQYDDEHMTRYDIPNVGYASVLVQIVDAMADNYCNLCTTAKRKIFITPKAEDFYSRKLNITDPTTKTISETNDGWAWADPDTCPIEVQHHDPWACNFMPLTSCTNRHLSVNVKKAPMKIWFTPTVFMAENKIDLAARKSCGDATGVVDEHWAQQRFAAWIQRPNARMRHLIRHSMHQLFALDNSGSGGGGGGSGLRELSHGPCVAIHVRHNDGMLDHRAQSGVDRSLAAHIEAARPFLLSLGARRIFLASDNVTVLETADLAYPEYVFFSQRRPMSTFVRFFGMFTKKYDSKDNVNEIEDKTITIPGYKRNSSTTYLELQESVASTLAHILADWRMASACSAAVGTFDSGYTQRMFQTMCAAGKGRGTCPPSTDLRKAGK